MKLTLLKPPKRNPLVAMALLRRAGKHRKSNKALRRGERVEGQRRVLDV